MNTDTASPPVMPFQWMLPRLVRGNSAQNRVLKPFPFAPVKCVIPGENKGAASDTVNKSANKYILNTARPQAENCKYANEK